MQQMQRFEPKYVTLILRLLYNIVDIKNEKYEILIKKFISF